MTTYVLVHGAWGGAHGFRHVRRLLHAAGHEVFTPSLTGVGERAHLTGPQVGLTTHVLDVVNTVLYEDLDRDRARRLLLRRRSSSPAPSTTSASASPTSCSSTPSCPTTARR